METAMPTGANETPVRPTRSRRALKVIAIVAGVLAATYLALIARNFLLAAILRDCEYLVPPSSCAGNSGLADCDDDFGRTLQRPLACARWPGVMRGWANVGE